MRVRRFELRLIAIALTATWSVAAALVLLAYRPGGPLDVLVGVTLAAPILIAAIAVAWPPVAHGRAAFPLMVCLGLGSLLVLLPSIGGVVNQLQLPGSRTLLPSLEAAYPWLLALVGTSLFAGFGLVRQTRGGLALRRRRLVEGLAVASLLTIATGGLFAGIAIANEVALTAAGPPAVSRYGSTTNTGDPPPCDARLAAGSTARLAGRLEGTVDLRPIGSVDLAGIRSGRDFRWLAYVATDREIGTYGLAVLDDRAWERTPPRGWLRTDPQVAIDGTGDLRLVETALTDGNRVTAEDHGMEVIEGARARRCRVAVDGSTFLAAFPQVRWLVGEADLGRWRGQLDYWVFMDGQLGRVAGSVNGEALGLERHGLLATIEVVLSATERGDDAVVYAPAP